MGSYDIMQESPSHKTTSAASAKRFLGEAGLPPEDGVKLKLRGPMEREEDALRVAAICCGKKVLPPAPPCIEKARVQAKREQVDPGDKYNLRHTSPSPSLLRLK